MQVLEGRDGTSSYLFTQVNIFNAYFKVESAEIEICCMTSILTPTGGSANFNEEARNEVQRY